MIRLYIIAMQFLTIIPLPFSVRCEKEDLGRSLAFFPLAGITIGALLAGLDQLISPWLPRPLSDAILIALITLITGALHMDGLADVCDGIAARGGRDRFLAVMKDSYVGAVGAAGVTLGLLLKWQALVAVPGGIKWQALLLFPLVARYAQVQSVAFACSARIDGLGSVFIAGSGSLQLVAAAIMTLVGAWLLMGFKGTIVFAIAALFTWFARLWFNKKIGGITGDAAGCISELNEILALLLVTVLMQF